MKIGIVGYGHAGRLYLRALEQLRQEVLHLADPSEPRLAEVAARDARLVTTTCYEDLPRDPSLDALVIATPLESRFGLAFEALQSGKHVLVDGPPADSAEQAADLAALALRRERVLLVGRPRLHCRAAAHLKELLRGPEAGALRSLATARSLARAARRVSDLLWDVAADDLALFASLLERAPEWVAAAAPRSRLSGQVDRLDLAVGYQGGFVARIAVAPPAIVGAGRLCASTERLRFALEDANPEQSVLRTEPAAPGGDRDDAPGDPRRELRFENPLASVCQHFVDCVEMGRPPLVGPRAAIDAARALETAEGCLADADPSPRPIAA